MEIESKKVDNILILKPLCKSIDAATYKELKDQVIELINQGNVSIILNFTHVDFIDSSGLGAIISILKVIAKKGKLIVCEIKDPVLSIFSITRFDRIIRYYKNENEAIQSFK